MNRRELFRKAAAVVAGTVIAFTGKQKEETEDELTVTAYTNEDNPSTTYYIRWYGEDRNILYPL